MEYERRQKEKEHLPEKKKIYNREMEEKRSLKYQTKAKTKITDR